MNNEEKILQLLEQMNARQDKTDAMLERMQEDISDIKTRVTNIEGRTERIETRVTKIEVTQENTVVPQIRLLAEGHDVIQNQIKNISVIDRMQEDIDTLKAAVSYLSNELKALKEAM